MTARHRRRRQRTVVAILTTVALAAVAFALVIVGTMTLLDSEEGEVIAVDDRQVVVFPETPNALLAVHDDEDRLTSLVVGTLDPEGAGGSIVTVPVNADATAGFEPVPVPLRSIFDPNDLDSFRTAVEGMLSITIEHVAAVDADDVREIVEPFVPIRVDMPEDVVDSDAGGSGIVVREGRRSLSGNVVALTLTAVDRRGPAYVHHAIDVAVWTRLAENAPVSEPRADPEVPPADARELFEDLWRGPVSVRDLAVSTVVADPEAEEIDAVTIDRSDALLVFAQVSPNLVSKPNQALSFRVVSRFDDEQLAESDGLFESTAELTRWFMAQLLFFQGNVVSADTSPAVEGAREVTLVEVADRRFLDDLEVLAEVALGDAEVVLADRLLEGVDVVVTLGETYIDHQLAIEAGEVPDLDESPLLADLADETDADDPAPAEPATTDAASGDRSSTAKDSTDVSSPSSSSGSTDSGPSETDREVTGSDAGDR